MLLFECRKISCSAQHFAMKSRVGKGISARAAHRTVREPLDSYGSCYPIMLLFPVSNGRTILVALFVLPCILQIPVSYLLAYTYSLSTFLNAHSGSKTLV